MSKDTKLVKLKPSVHQELLDIARKREVAIGDVVELLLGKWKKLQISNREKVDDTESIKKEMRKFEAEQGNLKAERPFELHEQIDKIFDDMVGRCLTLLESWGAIDEHGNEHDKVNDSRRRLIKQNTREAQGRIKDLDF